MAAKTCNYTVRNGRQYQIIYDRSKIVTTAISELRITGNRVQLVARALQRYKPSRGITIVCEVS